MYGIGHGLAYLLQLMQWKGVCLLNNLCILHVNQAIAFNVVYCVCVYVCQLALNCSIIVSSVLLCASCVGFRLVTVVLCRVV
jgi:hypothetical protein